MSVSVLLFCEGENDDSNDARFYKRLFESAPFVRELSVKSVGGKEGFGAAVAGFRRHKSALSPNCIIQITDRDFDCEPVLQGSSLQLRIEQIEGGYRSNTGRSCLESYFLDTAQLTTFATECNLRYSPDAIRDAVSQATEDISAYQAVRWAMSRQVTAWFPDKKRIRSSWLDKDGFLPNDLSLPSCRDQARGYFAPYSERFSNVVDLNELSQSYLEKFLAPGFLSSGGYTIWFHGKDLQAAIAKKLVDFPFRALYKWGIERSMMADFVDFQFAESFITFHSS